MSDETTKKFDGSRFWNAEKKGPGDPRGSQAASWVTKVASDIMTARYHQRFRNLTFWRHLTGRITHSSYAYSIAKRPSALASTYEDLVFKPPEFNACGAFCDVYTNRVFSNQPFMSAVPIRGDFQARMRSKYLPQWIDGLDAETGFWDQVPKVGIDCFTYGTGWGWVDEDIRGEKPIFDRPMDDELLFANEDGEIDEQDFVIRVVWGNREALEELHSDDKDAIKAIRNAVHAEPGVDYMSKVDYSNVVPYFTAIRKAHPDGTPGRRLVVCGNYTITDKPYEHPVLPCYPLPFSELPTGFKGQGAVEQICKTQRSVNRMIETVDINFRRHGNGVWLVESNSAVNSDALGNDGRGGGNVAKYTQTKPELITPNVITPQQFDEIDRRIRWMATRVHVSETAVSGSAPKSLQSAVSLEKYDQITDVNFQALSKRLEAWVVKLAYHKIRVGRELKVNVTLSGRKRQLINWAQVDIPENKVGMQIFPMSRLPQTIAGRQEALDAMLANNEITRETHLRGSQVPDVDGAQDRANALPDSIQQTLDDMIEHGDYIPPVPFNAAYLTAAKSAAETEWTLQSQDKSTPQDRLDLLLMYRAATIDLLTQMSTPPPVAGPQTTTAAPGAPAPQGSGFGSPPPATPPIIPPSPPQISPTLGLPAQP